MSAQFKLSRRDLLLSLPALGVVRQLLAQSPAKFKIRALNHMTIAVSDPKRTIDFYQTLFGMPIQAHQGPGTTVLRIGPGPQFLAVGAVGAGQSPRIDRYCVTIEDFSVDRILRVLGEHGITKSDTSAPMKVHVRMRGPENGGAKEGTPEVYVTDPDGIVVQLQDPKYGGGAGPLGEVLKLEPSPKKGLLALEDLSHFTISEK